MFPPLCARPTEHESILRACGDVSHVKASFSADSEYSPRMRRCFQRKEINKEMEVVFSAHAEMFLLIFKEVFMRARILRACGDVSAQFLQRMNANLYSPRMRRCFSF